MKPNEADFDAVFSKRDPDVTEQIVSFISGSETRKQINALAQLTWEFIDRMDRKHADTNYPYSDKEIKAIAKHANRMMHECKDSSLDKIADELFHAHTKLYMSPEKMSETEKVIAVNRIKDIIHQIFEPRFIQTKKVEKKKDLSIEGFPRFKKGKTEEQYRLIYQERLFWFYDVLKEAKGENFADALLTMDHDFGEFFLVLAHIGYDELAKDQILEKAVKLKIITTDQRIKLLEAFVYLFSMKILKSHEPNEEETNANLQKIFFNKYRKLTDKVEKKMEKKK